MGARPNPACQYIRIDDVASHQHPWGIVSNKNKHIWMDTDKYWWIWKDVNEFEGILEDMGVAATESFCQPAPAFTTYKTPSASP